MALFVTVRERRLWLWALAAAVAIYSTLGLTGTLARRTSEGGHQSFQVLSFSLECHVSVLGLHLDSVQLSTVVPYHHEVHVVGGDGFCYAIERFHLEACFFLNALSVTLDGAGGSTYGQELAVHPPTKPSNRKMMVPWFCGVSSLGSVV